MTTFDLSTLGHLGRAWRDGFKPVDVVDAVVERVDATRDLHAWITLVPPDELRAQARAIEAVEHRGPLWGVPFAVKDNIDVSGLPTTAGCPAFAYEPTETAPVVQRLLDAGALLVGKTNMDQFATGLSGAWSPYGVGRSVLDPSLISGGSSSGSAIAVAAGLVTFALGTDTAGSGRVPAACNGLVGLKPSLGLLSTRGVVPACRSLDCVSVFTHLAADAWTVVDVAAGFDALDPFSRVVPPWVERERNIRVGVPTSLLVDDAELHATFDDAVERSVSKLGADVVPFDLVPFLAAGDLLYGGAWLAERYASFGAFLTSHPHDVDPTVAEVVAGGRAIDGAQVFEDLHRQQELIRSTSAVWEQCDVIVVPTVDRVPTVDEVLADPIGANSRLGRFTTFVNLLGLAAVAQPVGVSPDGRPFGITLVGPDGADRHLSEVASRLSETSLGQTGRQPA